MNGNSTVAELPQALSLRQNFVWTLGGNIIYAACQWGMLVAIAKLGTPAMVGQFALGLAICAPIFMLTNLQLRAVQATDARHEYRFGHYLALRLLGTSLALVAILAVTMLAGYRRETSFVVLGVALAKAAESISDVLYGLLQNRECLDKISIAMIGRGIASLTAMAIVLYLTREIVTAVFVLALVWCTWLLTYECGVARSMLHAASGDFFRPAWQADRLKMLVHLSLPLGMVMLLLSLNANIPRYFVEHYLGEAALGYFSAMAYVVVAGSTVMGALGQSATPRLARYYQENKQAFAQLLLEDHAPVTSGAQHNHSQSLISHSKVTPDNASGLRLSLRRVLLCAREQESSSRGSLHPARENKFSRTQRRISTVPARASDFGQRLAPDPLARGAFPGGGVLPVNTFRSLQQMSAAVQSSSCPRERCSRTAATRQRSNAASSVPHA